VEFYVDGTFQTMIGTYPFATDLRAPLLTGVKKTFTVQARPLDTAGNAASSESLTITLTNELRRPFLISFTPASGMRFVTNTMVSVSATFNEELSLSSLASGWSISSAGPDDQFGTADDILLDSTVAQINATNYSLTFPQPLGPGFYNTSLTTNVTDLWGNVLRGGTNWEFGIRVPVTYVGLDGLWAAIR
jgi:hypothetical protein